MEITENKLNEILDKQRQEFQRVAEKEQKETRHLFGVLKEDFDTKIELIGEQYGTVKDMIGSLAEDIQVIKTDVEFIKGSLRKKVDYEEFEALAKRVSALEAKVRK